MKKYELMYILKADLTEEARSEKIASLHEVLTSNGAEITKVDEWGVRDFAYIMKDETKGYYVVVKMNADVTALNEFARKVRFDKKLIRHLITVDSN